MQIRLTNQELEEFIEDQVKAGNYPSAEVMVEAAINDLRESAELDDETVAAINEAEEQGDRGEGMDLDAFRAHMKRRIADR